MGSAGVAALIAQVVFLVVLSVGWSELGPRRGAVFIALWLLGVVGRDYIPYGADLFGPYVALLDIVLVFIVFKGDVGLR
jgi:hypothetical protein